MTEGFEERLQFGLLARIIRRRWRSVAACTVISGLIALAIGVAVPPRYTAKAQLVLDQAPGDRAVRLDDTAVQTWVELMSTDDHIRLVYDSLGTNPLVIEANEFDRPALTEWSERILDALASLSWLPQPDKAEGANAAEPPRMPSQQELDRRLKSFKERQSRIISVTFTWSDPNLAAAIANRSATLFLEETLRVQRVDRQRSIEELRPRIDQARSDLSRAAAALAYYRIEHGAADPDGVDQLDSQIAEVNRQLAIASSDLASHRKLASLDSTAALASRIPGPSQAEPTPSSIVSSDAAVLERRVRYLVGRLAALQEASASARSDEARLRELRLQAGTATHGYETLLNQEADLRNGVVQPQAHIVSVATPPSDPSSPDPILFVPPALVAGAIGGGLLAVLLERLDRRVRSERTAEAALGARCIGAVPKVRRMATLQPHHSLLRAPFAPYTRAVRSMTMAVLGLPGPQQIGKVILFTSATKGEGKTSLAVSFASYAALMRRNVLVVDLDLPSPGLGALFGAEPGPGALEALQGVPLEEAIRSNKKLGIDYLPLTSGEHDPLLLMSDDRARTLLKALRQRYECVVIDCAPLIGNPEVRMLIALADHVILTLKWGGTELDMARSAMREIQKARQAVGKGASVSSVITQVDRRMHGTYASPWPDDDLPRLQGMTSEGNVTPAP